MSLVREEAYLQHYGVLGMKWGVRRDQRILDRLAGRQQKQAERLEKRESKGQTAMTSRETRHQIAQKAVTDTHMALIEARIAVNQDRNPQTERAFAQAKKNFDDAAYAALQPLNVLAAEKMVGTDMVRKLYGKDLTDKQVSQLKSKLGRDQAINMVRYTLISMGTTTLAMVSPYLIDGASQLFDKGVFIPSKVSWVDGQAIVTSVNPRQPGVIDIKNVGRARPTPRGGALAVIR